MLVWRWMAGRGGDAAAARQALRGLAAAGDPYGHFSIGQLSLRGTHLPLNLTLARLSFEVRCCTVCPWQTIFLTACQEHHLGR